MHEAATKSVRLDKWLWAARFFKTRALASKAIKTGRVQLGGVRPKGARNVQLGDEIAISGAAGETIVAVISLSDRRGSATVAAGLYAETAASIAAREEYLRGRKLQSPSPSPRKRPDKRARGKIIRFIRRGATD